MTLRELERALLAGAVEWYVSGGRAFDSHKTEARWEKAMGALDELVAAYLQGALAYALDSESKTPGKNPVKTPLLLPGEASREQTVLITRRETIRPSPAALERKVEVALAVPAKKQLPAAKAAPAERSKHGTVITAEKKCGKCGKTYRPRGNRQMRCDACGARPPKGSQKKSGPGRPRTWKKKAKAEAPPADRYCLRPKPPEPDDPKKAAFDAWMRTENEKRAAAAKEISDRALAGIGANVEDVPIATAAAVRRP